MATEYFSVENESFVCNIEDLSSAKASAIAHICQEHRSFTLVGCWREIDNTDVYETIIVDCHNDQVPSRNHYGIRVTERLAIEILNDGEPRVLALRKNFPWLLHLERISKGAPGLLCLYIEPWSAIERTWTPEKYLYRILWWLEQNAKGKLHSDAQAPEQLFFNPSLSLVLPPDFAKQISDSSVRMRVRQVKQADGRLGKILVSDFVPNEYAQELELNTFDPLILKADAIVHGPIQQPPQTLGELLTNYQERNSPLLDKLKLIISAHVPEEGLPAKHNAVCLLIVWTPITRSAGGAIEKNEIGCYAVREHDIGKLGELCGILALHEGRYYNVKSIGASKRTSNEDWRHIEIQSLNFKAQLNLREARRLSRIEPATADFQGTIAGLGSLGSAILYLWAKECWGRWTLIDHDIIEPHNIARHLARDSDIGLRKVDVVSKLLESHYRYNHTIESVLSQKVELKNNPNLDALLRTQDFILDVTTTLEVPRDLAQKPDLQRCASAFVTPTGNASILLMEDRERTIRLDALEAQYYRAIINEEWGSEHLAGHRGEHWVGAGCRDVTAIIPVETIQLHASILARQIRLKLESDSAFAGTWREDANSSAVTFSEVEIASVIEVPCSDWFVVYDTLLAKKLQQERMRMLPEETGGVIVGYIDQKIKKIFVVDILPAPIDSESSRTGFIRGRTGLEESLNNIRERTANVVEYLGEWHSHPEFSRPNPSRDDEKLLQYLANLLEQEGLPALMMIVGQAGEISASVGYR